MPDLDQIRRKCAEQPGYEGATAYARTKVYCQVLTELGEPIPSWMVIREAIVKGSSGDINRGVKDFRREHAQRLRDMSGIVAGVPDALAPQIRGFWEAAVAAVRAEFEVSAARWQVQIDQAEARAGQADDDLAEAKAVAQRLEAQLATASTSIRGLEMQVQSERAGREQAERMFEANSKEMQAQRDRLEDTLKETKANMDRAFARLDGERRHALLQIEEARTKAAADLAAAKAKAERERSALELSVARLTQANGELQTKLTAAEQRGAVTAQQVRDLTARLERAEANVDRMAADNRRLVVAIKGRAASAPVPRPRVVTRLRGSK